MAADNVFSNHVRYKINRYIYDHGHAPTAEELAKETASGLVTIQTALDNLADRHAIVLQPGTHKIWVAHPFALDPTLFWVTSGNKKWWGTCSWCSLGIAAMTGVDTKIHTKLKGEERPVVIEIRDGQVADPNYVVHFPIPAKRTWDNVLHFCANTLLFSNEQDVDSWCHDHGVAKGEIVPVATVWELAKLWYGYYLSPDWEPKTVAFAQEIFQQVGLTSSFWEMA